ncbi:SDR family oxidoreductase [bacterium]|nr:SDR family oxidoreductase [bacterium]
MSKTLLITGASSDMAIDLINNIYKDYDKIIAHYNSSAKNLEALKSKIGDKLFLLQANFKDILSTEKFIDEISDISLPNHIVHFPATKLKPERFDKSNWNELSEDIMIQVHSIYKICQKFIKDMSKKENSKIIFVLTSAIFNTPKFNTNYLIAKYSLLGLMKSLSTEYSEKIKINAISPVLTETKFLENLPQFALEQSAQNSPIKRNLKPSDISPVIINLLSDNNNLNGQNILID